MHFWVFADAIPQKRCGQPAEGAIEADFHPVTPACRGCGFVELVPCGTSRERARTRSGWGGGPNLGPEARTQGNGSYPGPTISRRSLPARTAAGSSGSGNADPWKRVAAGVFSPATPFEERTRGGGRGQGAGMVQVLWRAVGGVEKASLGPHLALPGHGSGARPETPLAVSVL
jgi:hypothetical protein